MIVFQSIALVNFAVSYSSTGQLTTVAVRVSQSLNSIWITEARFLRAACPAWRPT